MNTRIDDATRRGGGSAPQELKPLSPEVLAMQVSFCKAMGHPSRLQILHFLHEAGGRVSSATLLELLGLSRASLSQHVAKMAAAGLVRTQREGRYLHIELACPEVGQACEFVHNALVSQARLRADLLEE